MCTTDRIVLAGSAMLAVAICLICCGPEASRDAPDGSTRFDAALDAARADSDTGVDPDASTATDAGPADAQVEPDAGEQPDAAAGMDAGCNDAGADDADASTGERDASEPADAGEERDASVDLADAGDELDASIDLADAGTWTDAGMDDDASTPIDAGASADGGVPDAASGADAGPAVLASLSPAALWAMLGGLPGDVCPADKGFVMIDVHVPVASTRIPCTDAVIDFRQLQQITDFIGPDLDTPVVLTCLSDYMSTVAGDQLIALGYRNVSQLAGGMNAWRAAGYPLR